METAVEQTTSANQPSAATDESVRTPFTFEVDGVSYSVASLDNDLTVEDAEFVAKYLSPIFSNVIGAGASIQDATLAVTAEFLKLIGTGNLREILARLVTSSVPVDIETKKHAVGRIPKKVAMTMLTDFFSSIGA